LRIIELGAMWTLK